MPEPTSNVEFAHKIHEQGHRGGPHGRAEWLEVIEAVALAVVAVMTAWSGYEAALWGARSAASYAQASGTSAAAQEQLTLAGQEHLYDICTFNSWMAAESKHDGALAEVFERRFRPEYAVAFAAWMKTDPMHDPKAPPGPSFMPQYNDARLGKARALSDEAKAQYQNGVATRQTGDDYVRITVVLATVLLLTAISQRFRIFAARLALVVIAFAMLVVAMAWISTFPRA